MADKQALRKYVLDLRENLSWEEIGAKSKKIAERLFALPEYRQAATVMYFLNFGKEADTLSMVPASLAHGKRVVAPKTVHRERLLLLSEITDPALDLEPGRWGIPEPKPERLRPVPAGEVDFVIVPGVAFDEHGRRLGYGGGYYDRFFAGLREEVPLVALTFELQVVPEVPVDPWDRRVDLVLTEERVIDCRQ